MKLLQGLQRVTKTQGGDVCGGQVKRDMIRDPGFGRDLLRRRWVLFVESFIIHLNRDPPMTSTFPHKSSGSSTMKSAKPSGKKRHTSLQSPPMTSAFPQAASNSSAINSANQSQQGGSEWYRVKKHVLFNSIAFSHGGERKACIVSLQCPSPIANILMNKWSGHIC